MEGRSVSKKILLISALAAASALMPSQAIARTEVRVVGSSTVYPFTTAVAERFARSNPKFRAPIVESTGTGGGIKLFCAGVGERFPDIANASRRMKASEAKICAANGVTKITEIQVGLDGLAIATGKSSPLQNISLRDLYMAVAKTPFGKPNTAKTWKDVNPKLPALKIEVYGPPPTSGTRDSFNELLMTPPCEADPNMAALKKSDEAKFKAICTGLREDGAFIEAGENDNLIVQKLATNKGTVGAFGYSYLEENLGKLRGVSLNGIAPSYASISTLKYPGARAMFIYVKVAHAGAIPSLRPFLAEYTKESTFGKKGYLTKSGLIASPDAVRVRAARNAATLAPLNFAVLK